MSSRMILLLILGSLMCLQGCETAKGAAEGFQKDVKKAWQGTSQADNWMRENMW